jgi:type III secretion protein J
MIRCLFKALALAILCVPLLACARAELLQGLDERQANEVVAWLLRHNIGAEKHAQGKSGFVVQVSPRDLAEAIDLVQSRGLPSMPRTQIAHQFPADAMISTPLAERARLLSAIEQRLEESLATLADVQSARVHVSYDAGLIEGSLQQRKPPAMHVAAVLVHVAGADEQALLQLARRFLRNAFVDVSYDDISVLLTAAQEVRTQATTAESRNMHWWGLLIPPSLLLLLTVLLWLMRRRWWRHYPEFVKRWHGWGGTQVDAHKP